MARFYQNVLDRPVDREGLAFWTGKLNEGLTFYDIAYSIINTAFQGGSGVNPLDQALVQNKVIVSKHVALTLMTNSAQLATVAFDGVTASPASVQTAFARLFALTQPQPEGNTSGNNNGGGVRVTFGAVLSDASQTLTLSGPESGVVVITPAVAL